MAGGRGLEVGNFAFDPDIEELALDHVADFRGNLRDGINPALEVALHWRSISKLPTTTLRDSHFLREVDILYRIQETHALRHRPLERLSARDQTHTAGALVHD